MMTDQKTEQPAPIEVRDLALAYGDYVVQHDLNFKIQRGDIFIIMGGSGCGKSTVLRGLVGLLKPSQGKIYYRGESFWDADPRKKEQLMKNIGISYQGGALWSSMTLVENVSIPLAEYTQLSTKQIKEIAGLKLALVGLRGFEEYYPSEISGGMQKRAGLARAMALDPEILFFDEPGAGLDPISARMLDDLIIEMRESLGATVVVVTHELKSIFAIGNNSVFLDSETKTMIASGDPNTLLAESSDSRVIRFLTRGEKE